MAFSNYGELKTLIANALGRSDLATAIVDAVGLTHKRIMRDLRGHPRLEKRNVAFSIDAEYKDAPTDYLEVVSFRITSTSPDYELTFMPNETQSAYYGTGSGQPKFVAVTGHSTAGTEQFRFAPVPDGTYTATLSYYASVTFFANDAATNWILTDHPNLYFAGSMAWLSMYIKDDPSLWKMAYDEELALTMRAGSRNRFSANGIVIRPA